MKFKHVSFARTGPARSWLIVACLLLFVASVAAQTVHLHPGDAVNAAKHCPTCQMAHSVLQTVPMGLLCISLKTTAYVTVAAGPGPKSARIAFSLFCRPPPLV
ncbi:MAG TPA: hypothetical protein VJ723_02200 [Candidatus Angelobacter sp.]|nr:hypothetical protein [Candidatus Angelobacter sp.]